MSAAGGREVGSRLLPGLLLALLTLGAIAGLLITRELRRGNDVVNSVKLTHSVSPGGPDAAKAKVRFRLVEGDQRSTVEVIDSKGGVTATLASGELESGRHVFRWDGRSDAGELVPPGRYRVRVVLADQGREVVPPGLIRVKPSGES